jgi:hypothetical protein
MEKNKINFITGETYTLADLFSGNRRIVIPDLQRDYCWGNETNKKASGEVGELVSDFINNLIEQFGLQDSDELSLGLFYGYEVPANHIQLCDGQQRLTTLYLLLGLLNKKTGKFRHHLISDYEYKHDDKEPYLNYAIRESSLYFLSDLVCRFFIGGDEEVETIRKSEWFFNEYNLDPSINSMLSALKIIEKLLADKEIPWLESFGDWLLHKLTFLYFDMENRRNGEETFVVINTTGEPLSATQNLKPLVIAADVNRGQQDVDKGWEELETWFWKHRCLKNGNDTADAGFAEFLRWVWMIEARNEKVETRHGKIDDQDDDGNRISYYIQLILKGTAKYVFPYTEIPYKTIERYWKALKWIMSQEDLPFDKTILSPAVNKEVNNRKALSQIECFVLLPLLRFVYLNISTIENDKKTQRNARRLYEFFASLKNVLNVSKAVNVLVRETLSIVDKLEDNDIVSLIGMSGISRTIQDDEELWKLLILKNNQDKRDDIEEAFWEIQAHEIWSGKILPILQWVSDKQGNIDLAKFKDYLNVFYKLFEEARHGKVITALRRSMIVLHDNYQPIRRSHYHSFGWDWSQWNDLLSRESDKTQMLFDYILERWDKSNDLADILESYIKENFKEKAYSEFAESDYLLSFMANSSATDIYFGENDWQIAMNGEVRHGIFLSRRNAYILREFGGDSKSTKSNPCAVSGTGWSVSYQGSDPKGNRIVFTHAQLPEAVEVSYKSKQDGSGTLEINSPSTKLLQLSNAIEDENQSISLNYEMESFDPSTIKNLIIDILVKLSSTEDVI